MLNGEYKWKLLTIRGGCEEQEEEFKKRKRKRGREREKERRISVDNKLYNTHCW